MNRTVVMTAVAQNGLSIKYAAICLRSDKEIAIKACEQNGEAFKHVSIRLKND